MVVKPWQEAQQSLDLSSGDIHIWSASFDLEDSSRFLPLLSDDEKKRADRLKSKTASDRQIISRGILRILLGRYINEKPEALVFNIGLFGKPYLSEPAGSTICFNISHSNSLVLFAFGTSQQIGIDVEKNDEKKDFSGISSMVFSSLERQLLSQSMDPIHDFFTLWTVKEAILKASGRGFSYPSNKFSVVISEGILSPSNIPTELTSGCSCTFSSFSPASGYSAAVAELR